jgi:hypothetical protein
MRLTLANFSGLLPLLTLAYCATAQTLDAHQIVLQCLNTMGPTLRLAEARQLHYEIKLLQRDIVENSHTGEPYPVRIYRASVQEDLQNFTRQLQYLPDQATPSVVTRTELTQGQATELDLIKDGKRLRRISTLASPAWEMRDPLLALRSALANNSLRSEADAAVHGRQQRVVSFLLAGFRVRLFIDKNTQFISQTQAMLGFSHANGDDIAQNTMGDVLERTEFAYWEYGSGIRYPTQWDTYQNDVLLQTAFIEGPPISQGDSLERLHLDDSTIAEADGLIATNLNNIPLGSVIGGGPDPHRSIEEIAPGIVQIPGSWYTTIIKQDDGIVIIDAPISSGYSKEVLKEVERRYPGLPVKALVTSTAFFWHVAGIREYARRQIPIYVRDLNVPILQKILAAPHTLVPDSYEQSLNPPIVRSIGAMTKIGNGINTVTILPNMLGTEPMLLTYIADAHLLHTGEMIQPLGPNGALLHPESLMEARDTVLREKLNVERLIGMHMSPISWRTLEEAVRKASGTSMSDSPSM